MNRCDSKNSIGVRCDLVAGHPGPHEGGPVLCPTCRSAFPNARACMWLRGEDLVRPDMRPRVHEQD